MTILVQETTSPAVELVHPNTELDTLVRGYRLCAATEGKSQKTIRITTSSLHTLKQFLEVKGYSTDINRITSQELREFILYLQQVRCFEHHPFTKAQDRGLSGHAINCYLRATRAFWSWLMREEIIISNPFARVKIPKPPQKVIATFSESQLTSMLKLIPVANPAGFRDWAMMLMLLDTGLRASELAHLTLGDVNLDEGTMKVRGKGNKERVVPFGARVQKALWKYIENHRPQPANPLCPTLFLTHSGKPITVNRLEAIIENRARKAGITGIRCSPHTFRHTFAISYLRNGGDVFSLQDYWGTQAWMWSGFMSIWQRPISRPATVDSARLII